MKKLLCHSNLELYLTLDGTHKIFYHPWIRFPNNRIASRIELMAYDDNIMINDS